MRRIRAVLIDIDGVLTVSWKPLRGAVAALHRLRTAGVPLALVTNTTSRTRTSIASALAGAGFPVTASDILTAPVIAAAYLHDRYPDARCLLLNSGDIAEDLAGLSLSRQGDQAPADVVLVGGAGPEFSYQALNHAFGHLQRGARLVAMHRGLYWRTSDGLQLDTGAFLAGLEQAAGTEAEVVGKPAPAFFATALARLGASAAGTVMVGDDIETDVLAAQRQGVTGVLVKTGKYLPRTHQAASGTPRPCPGLLRRPARPAGAPVVRGRRDGSGPAAGTGRTIPVRGRSISMQFTGYSFGSVRVDGVIYDHDLIIDRGKVRKRKKAASRRFRGAYGRTPLSAEEDLPWRCRRLVIGTGADGALPVMQQVRDEARRRKVDLVVLPTAQAIRALAEAGVHTKAILHLTCWACCRGSYGPSQQPRRDGGRRGSNDLRVSAARQFRGP